MTVSSTRASPPEGRQDGGRVTDAMIERALHARVPGGSEVWAWLPQLDAWTPHQTARDVMRCALEAALTHSTPVEAGERKVAEELQVVITEMKMLGFHPAWIDRLTEIAALAAQPLPKQGTGEDE